MHAAEGAARAATGLYTVEGWANMLRTLDNYLAGTLAANLPAPTGQAAEQMQAMRDEVAAELSALRSLKTWQQQVRRVNGGTAADDPLRQVSLHLTEWLDHLHRRGFPLRTLDKVMGTRPNAAKARLQRHRRLPASPSLERSLYKGRKSAGGAGKQQRLDITGERHGSVVAVRPTGESSPGGALWLLRCDCGNERVEVIGHFRRGRVTGCSPCMAVGRAEAARKANARRWAAVREQAAAS